jgi:hypothetical protein
MKHARPIVCEQTGEKFSSIIEASRWCGLSSNKSILGYLNKNNNRKSAGKHPITGEPLTWKEAEK